jgi:hypothetical protein
MNKNLVISLVFILAAGGIAAWGINHRAVPTSVTPEVVVVPEDTSNIPTTPEQKPAVSLAKFGAIINLKTGESVTFSDGLKVKLKKISDSRCKPDVQCIWAGELGVVLSISGGNVVTPIDIYLGPTTQITTDSGPYKFVYKNSTETSAMFVVNK